MEKHLVRAWLLQHPRVECDGKPLNIRLKKAQALLFYLLVQKKATGRRPPGCCGAARRTAWPTATCGTTCIS